MTQINYSKFELREPTILDEKLVLNMQQEFFNTNCKFNGTSDLNLFNNYIDWLANSINQRRNYSFHEFFGKKYTYLATLNGDLIGMLEIIFYSQQSESYAHIIECIRPIYRRQGYGKPLLKRAMHECCSFGIKKENISFERNNKASSGTMNKIMDF